MGEPLLVPLEESVQSLRRIHAQRTRNLYRARRLDPPIWKDTTISFAEKVLALPSQAQTLRPLLHQRTHSPLRDPPCWSCLRGLHHLENGAKPHTVGILSYCKRFKARKKAAECVAQVIALGQPPLPFPEVVLYTDGSASLSSRTAGWGLYAHRSENVETSLWGPVVIDSAAFNWMGASRPTNNAGEIRAIYLASIWLYGDSKEHAPATSQSSH